MKSLQRGFWRVMFPPIRLAPGALFEGFIFGKRYGTKQLDWKKIREAYSHGVLPQRPMV
jgi:hypothetical protein